MSYYNIYYDTIQHGQIDLTSIMRGAWTAIVNTYERLLNNTKILLYSIVGINNNINLLDLRYNLVQVRVSSEPFTGANPQEVLKFHNYHLVSHRRTPNELACFINEQN